MAKLILIVDGVGSQHFDINGPVLRIGRGPDNDVHIDDLAVSNEHAIIERQQDEHFVEHVEYELRDLGSTNNTFVNDIKISSKKLNNNDIVKIGWSVFKFVDDKKPSMDTTAYILPD